VRATYYVEKLSGKRAIQSEQCIIMDVRLTNDDVFLRRVSMQKTITSNIYYYKQLFTYHCCIEHFQLQESLADAKVSARQQCVYEGP